MENYPNGFRSHFLAKVPGVNGLRKCMDRSQENFCVGTGALSRAPHNKCWQFMTHLCSIGTMLVSSSYDETLVIWDVENCCQKFALKVKIFLFYNMDH